MNRDDDEILKAMLPAINEIDGGCPNCISAFIEEANRGLSHTGTIFRFHQNEEQEVYVGSDHG